LPKEIADRLEAQAAQQTGTLGPVLRQIVARAALDGNMQGLITAVGEIPATERALVHTAYFGDRDVLMLIQQHINRLSASNNVKSNFKEGDLEMWREKTVSTVHTRMNGITPDTMSPH
jgi:hypothetical protein